MSQDQQDQGQVSETTLRRVRKLIERAEHEGTPADERESCYAMADRLMTQHAIDKAMIDAMRPSERVAPVDRRVRLYQKNPEFQESFRNLIGFLATHHRVRAVHHPATPGEFTLVGYPDDLDYFEIVWTAAYLTFAAKMSPAWNPSENEDENIFRLKEAGVPWSRIADMGGFDWPDGGKLIRAYRRECKRRGFQPTNHTQRHGAYRQAYANGFVNQIEARCRAHANVRERQVAATTGAEVALRDRSQIVAERLYDLFPSLRPATPAERAAEMARYTAERQAAQEERERALATMTASQREAFLRREQREQERQNREWEREYRAYERATNDSAGEQAGRAAAETVDLSGGKNRLGTNRKELQ